MMVSEDGLLDDVIRHYLASREFNGLYVDSDANLNVAAAKQLVSAGLIQVVDSSDWMNPHIRPWPSKRSRAEQIGSIDALEVDRYGVCLYPTPDAMAGVQFDGRFDGQPYAAAMAKGRGTLELAYFRPDVLEAYRNDPRFSFRFNDYGADMGVTDEVYLDESETAGDKTSISHVGYAYDLSGYTHGHTESVLVRRVCAFYCDLRDLSPIHQQRWQTYEVTNDGNLEPHPVWWGQQMGHWPDGIGPFDRLFSELSMWNELHLGAYGEELLRATNRPDDFGWMLRPSQYEYDRFVVQLDKLISENIRHSALDSLRAERTDANGGVIGTLNRLESFLSTQPTPVATVKNVLRPLREVRKARQRPAHGLIEDLQDKSLVQQQAELLERVSNSIESLRRFWQTHPANSQWTEPAYALVDSIRYHL